MSSRKLSADVELELLQHEAVSYVLHETNPANGLVIDKTVTNWPVSMAATGLASATYTAVVEPGFMPREERSECRLSRQRNRTSRRTL
jgi:hypothetical protein